MPPWLALIGIGWIWKASGWLWLTLCLALAGSGCPLLALAGSGWLWLTVAGLEMDSSMKIFDDG